MNGKIGALADSTLLGLPVQNILGDLFASLSIAVDKPFEVGDAIGIGEQAAHVEETPRAQRPAKH